MLGSKLPRCGLVRCDDSYALIVPFRIGVKPASPVFSPFSICDTYCYGWRCQLYAFGYCATATFAVTFEDHRRAAVMIRYCVVGGNQEHSMRVPLREILVMESSVKILPPILPTHSIFMMTLANIIDGLRHRKLEESLAISNRTTLQPSNWIRRLLRAQ